MFTDKKHSIAISPLVTREGRNRAGHVTTALSQHAADRMSEALWG